MELFYILLVLLFVTRFFGELAVRFGQTSLIGELIAGIFLGLFFHHYADVLPVLSNLRDNEVFLAIIDLAIFFLMLAGGIELRPKDITRSSFVAFWVACGGMLLPFSLACLLGIYTLPASDLRFAQIIFLGTSLSVTAVPVAVKVLMETKALETEIGGIIVSAAVIDDVLSLMLLAVLTGVARTHAFPDLTVLGTLLGKIIIFFVVAILLGKYLFPFVGNLIKRAGAEEFELSMLLVAAFAYAFLAEKLGLHFILGAFLAGLFFGRSTIDTETYDDIQTKVNGISTGFLAPLFFASIGLHLDLMAISKIPVFICLLIALAVVGKVIGAGLPARIHKLSWRQSSSIGVAMNARGAVELIIADIARRNGLFAGPNPTPDVIEYLFSAVVIMAIFTTLITPFILKKTLHP